ncbi:putative hydrolase [Streptomyces sp. Tu6071]|nr:putative hydrolase [Streptomyces sp. Tu6071]
MGVEGGWTGAGGGDASGSGQGWWTGAGGVTGRGLFFVRDVVRRRQEVTGGGCGEGGRGRAGAWGRERAGRAGRKAGEGEWGWVAAGSFVTGGDGCTRQAPPAPGTSRCRTGQALSAFGYAPPHPRPPPHRPTGGTRPSGPRPTVPPPLRSPSPLQHLRVRRHHVLRPGRAQLRSPGRAFGVAQERDTGGSGRLRVARLVADHERRAGVGVEGPDRLGQAVRVGFEAEREAPAVVVVGEVAVEVLEFEVAAGGERGVVGRHGEAAARLVPRVQEFGEVRGRAGALDRLQLLLRQEGFEGADGAALRVPRADGAQEGLRVLAERGARRERAAAGARVEPARHPAGDAARGVPGEEAAHGSVEVEEHPAGAVEQFGEGFGGGLGAEGGHGRPGLRSGPGPRLPCEAGVFRFRVRPGCRHPSSFSSSLMVCQRPSNQRADCATKTSSRGPCVTSYGKSWARGPQVSIISGTSSPFSSVRLTR